MNTTNPSLRQARREDVERCALICHEAFGQIADHHRFPSDSESVESSLANFARWVAHPGYHVIVAEIDGSVVGSIVVDERSSIAGLGPMTVSLALQNLGLGRELMQAALQRAGERGFAGVRFVQAAYHMRTLCLYVKLGSEIREPLVSLQGPPLKKRIAGYAVRRASHDDLIACAELCRRIHGHDRRAELAEAIASGSASVVEHDDRLTGYATALGFYGHAVGESNADLKALIAAAETFAGQEFLLPTRNGELLRWCLSNGLRAVQPLNLMSIGLYNEPLGAFLPSISY